jgi:hypothetical protein
VPAFDGCRCPLCRFIGKAVVADILVDPECGLERRALNQPVRTIWASPRVTPAMTAGLSETVMDWADIVEAMDAEQSAKKRGPYKRTNRMTDARWERDMESRLGRPLTDVEVAAWVRVKMVNAWAIPKWGRRKLYREMRRAVYQCAAQISN